MSLVESQSSGRDGMILPRPATDIVREYIIQQGREPTGNGNAYLASVAEPLLGIKVDNVSAAWRVANCAVQIRGLPPLPLMTKRQFRRFIQCGKLPKPKRDRPPKQRRVKVKPKPKQKLGPEFYETPEWRRVRYKAIVKNDGCCQCCKARPEKGKPLHVDHIKPKSKYPELALKASNLQVLCRDCNLGS